MKEKEPQFKPGDQVCTVHDITGADWDRTPYLNVAKGRLGEYENHVCGFLKTRTLDSARHLVSVFLE